MSHTLQSGALNRRITLQNRFASVDSYGQQSTIWSDQLSCWASITPLSGRELVAAQAMNAEVTHEIRIRYRPGITAAMRATYQGRIFNIQAVTDVDTAHVELQLLCSEGLNNG